MAALVPRESNDTKNYNYKAKSNDRDEPTYSNTSEEDEEEDIATFIRKLEAKVKAIKKKVSEMKEKRLKSIDDKKNEKTSIDNAFDDAINLEATQNGSVSKQNIPNYVQTSVSDAESAKKCISIAKDHFDSGNCEKASRFIEKANRLHPDMDIEAVLNELQSKETNLNLDTSNSANSKMYNDVLKENTNKEINTTKVILNQKPAIKVPKKTKYVYSKTALEQAKKMAQKTVWFQPDILDEATVETNSEVSNEEMTENERKIECNKYMQITQKTLNEGDLRKAELVIMKANDLHHHSSSDDFLYLAGMNNKQLPGHEIYRSTDDRVRHVHFKTQLETDQKQKGSDSDQKGVLERTEESSMKKYEERAAADKYLLKTECFKPTEHTKKILDSVRKAINANDNENHVAGQKTITEESSTSSNLDRTANDVKSEVTITRTAGRSNFYLDASNLSLEERKLEATKYMKRAEKVMMEDDWRKAEYFLVEASKYFPFAEITELLYDIRKKK